MDSAQRDPGLLTGMSPRWALMELENSVCNASEVARLNERWDVVEKVEQAARLVREAVAIEMRQPADSGNPS